MRKAALLFLLGAAACAPQGTFDLPLNGEWTVAQGFHDPALPLSGVTAALPVKPNEIFQNPGVDTLHVTLQTSFDIDDPDNSSLRDPAFLFPILGEGYRVYLNGQEVASNLYLDENGNLERVTSGRGLVLPFPQRFLRKGKNTVVIHLAGFTPRTPLVSNSLYFGLPVRSGYRMASHRALVFETSEIALYGFTGIYGVFGLYSLLYFLRRREPRYTLYFALFTFSYSLYLACLSNRAFEFVPDVRPLITAAYAAQPASLLFFVLFLSRYFHSGRHLVRLAVTGDAVLVAAGILLPYSWMQNWLLIFYAALGMQILLVLYILGSAVRARLPDSTAGAVSFSLGLAFIVWDVLDTLVLNINIRLSRYAHFPVILSMMVMVVNRSLGAMAEAEGLNRELSLLTRDLDSRVQERTRQFEAAMQTAEKANRAKTSFLANMSHEIRTPLNVMLGMGEWLHERESDPEKKNALSTMVTAGSSLLNLIQELLDLARIESGTVRLESRVFDPELIGRESLEFFEARAQEKLLKLRFNGPGESTGLVLGDPDRLRQVIVNLLGNAVKFTEAGEVILSIEIIEKGAEKIRLRFSVKDTGPGVPEDQARVIFERFSQGHMGMNRKHSGTGLGLSISQDLVGLMGGRIELHSREGAGAEFFFEIEFRRAMETKASHEMPLFPAEERPLRILVAEDNEANRNLLSAYFTRTPHTLEFAFDGREAVSLFQARHFDLVLMDIMMPEMDGIEATVRIRRLEQELLSRGERTMRVPIIALSAAAYAEDVALCRHAGCDEHMAKPVKKVDLFKLIARVTAAEKK